MALVTIDRQGPVLVITLNRPQARNAVNAPMAAELGAAIDRLEGDPELRVGILRAEVTEPRPVFCAGHDLKTIEEEQNGGPRAYTDKGGFAGFVKYPRTKPVIAAVDGLATSGGFEIVLACDLVVATTRSSFALAEVRWNAVAGSGALFRLPWLVGRPVAMDMILSGEPVDAQRAYQLGLVGTLAGADDLDRVALARAAAIGKNGPIAVAASFRVADKAFALPAEQLWAMIDEAKQDVLRSRDLTAGLAAFAAKTEPVYKGS
jgi:enoyl-CoA hydratase